MGKSFPYEQTVNAVDVDNSKPLTLLKQPPPPSVVITAQPVNYEAVSTALYMQHHLLGVVSVYGKDVASLKSRP